MIKGLFFPSGQPLKFYLKTREVSDEFNSVPYDQYAMQIIAPSHLRRNRFRGNNAAYYVLRQNSDYITVVHNVSNADGGTFSLRFIDKLGAETVVSPSSYLTNTTRAGNTYDANGTITPVQLKYSQWKFRISDVIGLSEGVYTLEVRIAYIDTTTEVYTCEPLWIKNAHPKTQRFQPDNELNEFGFFWDLNPIFQYRYPSYLKLVAPSFDNEYYTEQNQRQIMLSGRSTNVFDVKIMNGIPDYEVDKLRFINTCDSFLIDTRRYIKDDKSEFNLAEIPNTPLYTLTYQVKEYFPDDVGSFLRSVGVFIMPLGNFPYTVSRFKLIGDAGLPTPNPDMLDGADIEILNQTDEDALLARFDLNIIANSMTGTFITEGNNLYYENGTGEDYVIDEFIQQKRCVIFEFANSPSDENQLVDVTQTGDSVVSLRRKSTGEVMIAATIQVGTFSTLFGVPAPDYDDYVLRIYSDDTMTILSVSNAGKTITNIYGTTSNTLVEYYVSGGVVPVFSTDVVALAKQTLTVHSSNDMGHTSIAPEAFVGFELFASSSIAENDLTDAGQDAYFIAYHDRIFIPYSLTGGSLSTVSQTTGSLPTALSSTQRTAMMADGYTIAF